MKTFILAAHGGCDFNQQTEVPKDVQILFYQPFGKPLDNQVALEIQHALTQKQQPRHPSVALWKGPMSQKPWINLSPEKQGNFISGYICVETQEREYLTENKLWTLQYVVQEVKRRYPNESISLHYLACLTLSQ